MPTARTFCCAKNCYNYIPSGNCPTFFNLPCDGESRSKWVDNAGRPDLKNKPFSICTGKYLLCADHFESHCFVDPEKKTILRRDIDIVPTLFESNLSSLISMGNGKVLEESQDSMAEAVIENVVSAQDILDPAAVPDDVLDTSHWSNIVAVSLGDDGNLICDTSGSVAEVVEGTEISLVESENSDPDTLVVECLTLCRLCADLVQVDLLVPVFGEGSDANLQEMIERVLPGQVVQGDGLPQRVCTNCVARVRGCCEILDLFHAANDRLRHMIELCNLQANALENNGPVMVETVNNDIENNSTPILVGTVDLSGNVTSQDFGKEEERSPTHNGVITSMGLVQMQLKQDSVPQSEPVSLLDRKSTDDGLSARSIDDAQEISEEGIEHRCLACQEMFSEKTSLLMHCVDMHSTQWIESVFSSERISSSFKCQICDEVFPSLNFLQSHMKVHIVSNYTCRACSFHCSTKSKLKVHIRDQHSIDTKEAKQQSDFDSCKCDGCGKEFRNQAALKKHKLTHTGKSTVLCSLCGKTLANLNSLRVHMRVHSEERPYSCNECGKSFKGSSELRSHSLTHTREKVFNCPECGRKFHSKGLVRQHLLSHTADKPHKCDICTAAFNRLGNLNQHRKKHVGNIPPLPGTPFECTMCGKRFQSKLTLKYHIARHTGDKYPFDCEVCGKKFIAIDPYRVHMRIHTGERPFECAACKKTFRSSATLKQHTASLHQDDFPFSCPFCQRSFKRLQSLVVHKKTHTGEKPWLCSQCGRAFAQKGDMLKHARTHRPQHEEETIIMEVDSIDELALDSEISEMIFG